MGKQALGFDFGTSNCTVSIFDSDKGIVETLPISNYSDTKKRSQANQSLFPSKVGLTDELEWVFGDDTRNCERDFVFQDEEKVLSRFFGSLFFCVCTTLGKGLTHYSHHAHKRSTVRLKEAKRYEETYLYQATI